MIFISLHITSLCSFFRQYFDKENGRRDDSENDDYYDSEADDYEDDQAEEEDGSPHHRNGRVRRRRDGVKIALPYTV